MRAILDASVGLKWLLVNEADADKAARLRNEFLVGMHDLLAPDVFPIEVANALTRAERRKEIPVGKALTLFGGILRTLPAIHPTLPLVPRATEIS